MPKLRPSAVAVAAGCAFAAIAGRLPIADAADIDHWALCMGGAGPARAIQECSVIIDSKHELSDSLPYAYVYRGRAHVTLKQADSALADFTGALHFDLPLAHAHFGLGQVYQMRED